MLAKYLIAGGIIVADPNKIEDSTELAAPWRPLVVAPRREPWPARIDRSPSPSTTARPSSPPTRQTGRGAGRWDAPGPIASLAYDAERHSCTWVARTAEPSRRTSSRACWRHRMAAPRPRGRRSRPSLSQSTRCSCRPTPSDPLLLRGPDGIAVIDRETGEVRASADGLYGGIGLVTEVEEMAGRGVVTDPERGVGRLPGPRPSSRAWTADDEPLDGAVTATDAPLIGPLITRAMATISRSCPDRAAGRRPRVPRAAAAGSRRLDGDGEPSSGLSRCRATAADRPPPLSDLVYVAGTDARRRRRDVGYRAAPRGAAGRDDRAGRLRHDRASRARRWRWRSTSPPPHRATTTRPAAGHHRRCRRDGALVRIDAGSNAFAWRLAGVGFGAAICRPDLPARRHDVQPASDRGPGRRVRGDRRHELRDEPDQHERHLRRVLHRRRVRAVLAGVVGPMGTERLVGPAARRRPHRPGGGHEVGRLLRDGRADRARAG